MNLSPTVVEPNPRWSGIVYWTVTLRDTKGNTASNSFTVTYTPPPPIQPSRPSPPKLISPGTTREPGIVINTLTPKLQWAAVPNADYYALAISIYPYGTSYIVYNPQKIYGTSITVPSGYLTKGKKYCWNMQAYNSAGWSSISETLYFQTPP
jgi:hypothetical protein